jgi:hypothetical protein
MQNAAPFRRHAADLAGAASGRSRRARGPADASLGVHSDSLVLAIELPAPTRSQTRRLVVDALVIEILVGAVTLLSLRVRSCGAVSAAMALRSARTGYAGSTGYPQPFPRSPGIKQRAFRAYRLRTNGVRTRLSDGARNENAPG